jgi:hypothetical protein
MERSFLIVFYSSVHSSLVSDLIGLSWRLFFSLLFAWRRWGGWGFKITYIRGGMLSSKEDQGACQRKGWIGQVKPKNSLLYRF